VKHYEDMTEIDCFIDDVANLVHAEDGGDRMNLGSALIEKYKPIFTRATRAEGALGEAQSLFHSLATHPGGADMGGMLLAIKSILDTYYGEK